jgi:multiple sugar transport system permease protein
MEKIEQLKAVDRLSMPSKVSFSRVLLYVFLILLAIVCLIPFYILIINSTQTNADLAAKLNLLPGTALVDNFVRMVKQINIWQGYYNSIVISAGVTILSCYFGGLTAFGFAKYKFKGNKILFLIVLATIMIPKQLGLIGFFSLMHKFGMLDTFWPLILPAIGNSYAVFFIYQFIKSSIPDEIIEAARMDGCAEFMIFNRIVFPMLLPCIGALSVFTFIYSWNNFLTPLVLLFSNDKFPLPVLVIMIKGSLATDYGTMYVGAAMSILPIMIVFFIASRFIINGLTFGAVKG